MGFIARPSEESGGRVIFAIQVDNTNLNVYHIIIRNLMVCKRRKEGVYQWPQKDPNDRRSAKT